MTTRTLVDTDSVQIVANKWLDDVRQYQHNVDTLFKHGTINAALANIGTGTHTTLVVTENTAVNADTDLTSYPNIHWLFLGAGQLTPATGTTLTLHSPGSIVADMTQFILDASAGTIVFANGGTVSPCWFGAVGNGSTDDGTALTKMVAACPAKSTYQFPARTFKSTKEMAVTEDDITVRMTGATLDLATIAGIGTSGVHESLNVLCGFKVTGDRFTMWDGRITGDDESDSKKVVGVLIDGADSARINSTKVDSLYCGLWAGGGATNVTFRDVEVAGCARNILMGYMPSSAANPNVTRASLLNVHSHNGTGGDGVKLHTHARDVEIIGGYYHDNSNNGIDLYVCGEYVTVHGAISEGNGVDGIDVKYNFDTGEGAGQLGFARRTSIRSCILRGNAGYGIRGIIDDAYTGTETGVQNVILEGNIIEGNDLGIYANLRDSVVSNNIIRANTGRGANFHSCENVSVIGNQFWDNGTSNASGCVFGVAAYTGAGNNKKCTVIGNCAGDTRSGGARTQVRGFEFANMDECVILGNTGQNHATADFNCSVSQTGGTRSAYNSGTLEAGSTMFGVFGIPIVARASLPAAGATQDGLIIVDDNGAGDRNLMVYAGTQRFRIDGGAAV